MLQQASGSSSSPSKVYRRAANASGSPGASSGGCDAWEDAQHVLWQGAQLCCAAAFLIPHRFAVSSLLFRWLLTLSFSMTSIWAGVVVCAPDVLAWHLTCLLVNASHAAYLAWQALPPRVPPLLRTLYERLFLPYLVSKKQFVELVKTADVCSIEADHKYAVEGSTAADQKVSILLTGKMQVSCEDVLLHYIHPNEFIDSPEFESCPIGSDKLFQVTITAIEPCSYLCWPRRRLHQVLRLNPALTAIVHNLVGRDIAHKLYSLAEFHRLGTDSVPRPLKDLALDWWKTHLPRSLSVDAVYTGPRGRMRSQAWQAANDAGRRRPFTDTTGSHLFYGAGKDSVRPYVRKQRDEPRLPAMSRCVVQASASGKATTSVLPITAAVSETPV
ncbi:blood vessel epicardial substance isoform X1 [Ixodes scapularis]|uniref:blood vessel epicardial substance isoform X1 n=1 Tax=Ixodes scapularis TaxID=6945 RepID=UPI001AD7D961|nr:blood vessel epicardial substance isoform X1 [Ixodes scapularis]